jgi:hypothetical protein
MRVPANNRLEKLKGEREERYSIRINDQWRVCFRWIQVGPARAGVASGQPDLTGKPYDFGSDHPL